MGGSSSSVRRRRVSEEYRYCGDPPGSTTPRLIPARKRPMNQSHAREVLLVSLFVLLSAFVGLAAAAQGDDYLDRRRARMVGGIRVRSRSRTTTARSRRTPLSQLEGDSRSRGSSRRGASPPGAAQLLAVPQQTDRRLVRIPIVSAATGNRVPRKSDPVLLRCRGWCQSRRLPDQFTAIGHRRW